MTRRASAEIAKSGTKSVVTFIPYCGRSKGAKQRPWISRPRARPKAAGAAPKNEEQRRAEDEMHLRHADRIVRQHLEEGEDGRGRQRAAGGEGSGAALDESVASELQGVTPRAGGSGVAQGDLRAGHDARFDMHVMSPSPSHPTGGLPVSFRMAGLLARGSGRRSAFPGHLPVAFGDALAAHSRGGGCGCRRGAGPHSLSRPVRREPCGTTGSDSRSAVNRPSRRERIGGAGCGRQVERNGAAAAAPKLHVQSDEWSGTSAREGFG